MAEKLRTMSLLVTAMCAGKIALRLGVPNIDIAAAFAVSGALTMIWRD